MISAPGRPVRATGGVTPNVVAVEVAILAARARNPLGRPHLDADRSFVAVNTASVAEEEIKYTLDGDGYVKELSKQVADALGEAVGINYVAAADRDTLIAHLDACADTDYFERGLETAIAEAGLRVAAVDISAYGCVEVDFEPDLARANQLRTGA